MSALGDKIKAAGADRPRQKCTFVLGGEEHTIYAKAITGVDLEWVQRRHKEFATNPSLGAAVDLIIRKSETEAGEQAFDMEDKPILLRQTISFISHIRDSLFPQSDTDFSKEAIEDELKN